MAGSCAQRAVLAAARHSAGKMSKPKTQHEPRAGAVVRGVDGGGAARAEQGSQGEARTESLSKACDRDDVSHTRELALGLDFV